MKRIKFVYIYFLFLLYFIGGYFIKLPFIDKGIYEKIYKYLGIMLIPALLFFILYGFVFLIKDKKVRFFWELRVYYKMCIRDSLYTLNESMVSHRLHLNLNISYYILNLIMLL